MLSEMKLGRIVFSKSFCLKLLSEYVSIVLGVTKMVDGWPSPEGL